MKDDKYGDTQNENNDENAANDEKYAPDDEDDNEDHEDDEDDGMLSGLGVPIPNLNKHQRK